LFYGEGGKFREHVQRMLDHVPLGRPATTDEIAVAALFLSDPEKQLHEWAYSHRRWWLDGGVRSGFLKG